MKFSNKVNPLTIIITAVLLVIFVLFGLYFFQSRQITLNAPPEIIIGDDVPTQISVTATEAELLEGIKAIDPEDGDVTKDMIIESFTPFDEEQKRLITYVAFDSNNNVTKEIREISYTDYTPPVIEPIKKLVISAKITSELLECFQATDVIDGDISSKIKVISFEDHPTIKNRYVVELSVTNSCGDTTNLATDILIG